MKALVLEAKNASPQFVEVAEPTLQPGEVVVELKAASLNHRDLWIQKGQYPGLRFPLILGSDGAGIIEGKEVVIQPGKAWGSVERFQGSDYQILGLPQHGTFGGSVAVCRGQVYEKPPHLSMEEAAALPLAGLTAFRALFSRCKAQAGEKLLVTGIGGGVALFCLQFALKAGLEVFVTSGNGGKIERAMEMGAAGGANYQSPDWLTMLKKQTRGFDVIIDGAGGQGFSDLVKLANPGGRIGVYGGTHGAAPNFSLQPVFWKQLSILGSTMGSDQDFADMLSFVNKHEIVPVIDSVYPLEDGATAFERMASGKQFGKIVLKTA